MSISSIGSYSSYLYDYTSALAKSSTASKQSSGADGFFSKVDSNQDKTVDQSELQSLVDDITASTGQSVDVASVFSEYDTDGDGSFSDDELRSFMQSNDLKPEGAPKGPPPQGMQAQNSDDEDEDDYSTSEYYLQLLDSMQNSLLGDSSEDGSSTGSLFQSSYDSVIQMMQSQYSAEA